MSRVAGRLRLDMSQYSELAAFAQFASDLDKRTRDQIERGKRMTELLKQGQYAPMPIARQVMVLFAGVNGYVDDVPVESVRTFERELLGYLDGSHPEIEQAIAKERVVSEQTEKALRAAIEEFRKGSPLVSKQEAPRAAEGTGQAQGPLQRARQKTEGAPAKAASPKAAS